MQVSPSEGWIYREAENVNLTTLDINDLERELYVIKTTFTNNENMSSTSEEVVVDLSTMTSVFTTTSLPDKTSVPFAASGSCAAALGTGSWVVVAVATFLLGVLLTAVAMLVVFR
ncbi:hypothetical protein NP493_48g07045 [Ridgeia piscesae]|uniref:Uncharacterized protein n=1 Tax=Ridgeia piscesae TaxID=27915 RepID=A0AAD9UJD6_RIDPI|nr:hypothetical protein NP493_48g07045 [Ridgeia piscesae]